ncbi:MAG TPA: von Willebrand factor type A domain-containing protein [Candidatus Anammoximicrobium sp.]|nr:von Willebrand factor type A domain-containing protein [Candidatus Anammoximicrobium sp.]
MRYDPQDPRITAYVLGELDGQDKTSFEAEMASCDDLRQVVKDTRQTLDRLSRELAGEPSAALSDKARRAVTREIDRVRGEAREGPPPVSVAPAARRSVLRPVIALAAIAASLLMLVGGSLVWYSLEREYETATVARSQVEMPAPISPSMASLPPAADGGAVTAGERGWRFDRTAPPPGGSGPLTADYDFRIAASTSPVGVESAGPMAGAGTATSPAASSPSGSATPGFMFESESTSGSYGGRVADPRVQGVTESAGGNYQALDGPPMPGMPELRGLSGAADADGPPMPGMPPQEVAKHEASARPDLGQGPGWAGDRYSPIVENPFQEVKNAPLSTFSIDVDTASYSKVRMYLMQQGVLPRPDAVRIEELVNYFTYEYAPPADDRPFAAHLEVAECPWTPAHRLVRVGIKGKEIDRDQRPSSNLVFLLDVSGSMNQPNKLPLVKQGMKMLVDQLNENDSVAIVVYAAATGLVLEPTTGDHKQVILDALDRLHAGGSTNGGAGIQLAYQTALDHFIRGGVNRVILCTDGDFNVGVTGTDELVRMAEQNAKTGVFLSVLGFGMGNHNDAMLEQISGKGNGNYAFIDTETEARKVLVEQMAGTLVTIAKDVKIQVEFNPQQVSAYRLIGYENRILAAQDFNDDKKDAGEIGAGHTVTALYEIVPAGTASDVRPPPVDDLRYQTKGAPNEAAQSGELLTLKMRYKAPDGDTSTKLEFPARDEGRRFGQASQDFRFAAAVASFGMLLRDSQYKGSATYAGVLETATEAASGDTTGYREEFLKMVARARELTGR